MTYWWRPYIAWGRRQLRIGVMRRRRDRVCPEWRYVALEWQL